VSNLAVSVDQSNNTQVNPEFSHIHQIWDSKLNKHIFRIQPGEYFVTTSDEMITTVLGSCISACRRDESFHVTQ